MDTLRKNRIIIRITVMVTVALVLALFPQFLIKRPVLAAFYLDSASQDIAVSYQKTFYWAHFGGIMALFAANLIFFIVNEKKGDTGKALFKRIWLQNSINVALICAGIGAMIGIRVGLVTAVLVGLYISENIYIILISLLPYIMLVLCGVAFCLLCMRCIPATNVPLRSRIAARWDDKLKMIKN